MIKGFSLDIYDSDIAFAWDTSEKELTAYFNKVNTPKEYVKLFLNDYNEASTDALTIGYSGGKYLFTVFKNKPTQKVIAHEIYHIAYNVLKPRQIDDEEAWAYLIGYLTEEFFNLYNEK